VAKRWQEGKCGKGRVIFFDGYAEPIRHYIAFVRATLRKLPALRPQVRDALGMESSREVYWSALANGKLALLNYDDQPASVRLVNGKTLLLKPYTIAIE
jgi:hypothetical protein